MHAALEQLHNRLSLTHSTRTVEAYLTELRRFSAWGGRANSNPADLDRYLAERKAGGLGSSGLGVAVCALRKLYRFLDLPATVTHLKLPRNPKRIQRALTADELMRLLSTLDSSTVTGKRDLALVGLAVSAGLRATELCRLRLADVDLEQGQLKVLCKGGQWKFGVFDAYAAALIAAWLPVRPAAAADTLFVSLARSSLTRGQPLTRGGLKTLCRRLAIRAGIPHFSPHSLRRTFATLAIEYGAPSRLLQEAGRWSSLDYVELYSRGVRMKAFTQYSPLARLMGR